MRKEKYTNSEIKILLVFLSIAPLQLLNSCNNMNNSQDGTEIESNFNSETDSLNPIINLSSQITQDNLEKSCFDLRRI